MCLNSKVDQLNLGEEEGKVLLFANSVATSDGGKRACVGVGTDVTATAERVRKLAIGESGQVFVVDEKGFLQIYQDRS